MEASSSCELGMIIMWEQAKVRVIVPFLRVMVVLCLIMTTMLILENLYMGIVLVLIKLFGKRPEQRYKWKPMAMRDDAELGYPMVLVQIPMYNEREVYHLSIGAACELSWPSDRIIIQVLDDSTDPAIKELVRKECEKWRSKGVNIKHESREKRDGYKAGALRDGMKQSYVKVCEYIAVLDADSQPQHDFLRRAIPYLIHNPELALVQARWTFVNADKCLMTRMQEMSQALHFTVEQEIGSSINAFFAFNGTGGVWRISAIEEAGGWKDRTTVEDMDLAVRATLKGWKFVYLSDLEVKTELPSSFKAFRYQQHRWSCGPAILFRKMGPEIMRAKQVNFWKKLYLLYSFFLVRKIIAYIVAFVFYCVVMPATVLFPEVEEISNKLGAAAAYIPAGILLLNAVGTPRSIHLLLLWVLFETMMSLHRAKACLVGLLESGGRVNEWVVTQKLGPNKGRFRSRGPRTLNLGELFVGIYLFFCGCVSAGYGNGNNRYYVLLFLQATAFFIAGVGYVGINVPSS